MSDTFYCAAPWRGLHINFRGDVKTCCAGDPNILGNLNQQSIEQVLQSSKMQEIRQTIKNGQLHPEYCSNCINAERYGRSERHWHNDVNPEFDATQATQLEHLPSIIDVRWNITCNLACNYCGPYCSSKWASLMKFDYKNGARPYYEQVCEYIEQHRDNVKEVALVGGEPLLLPENERLLDVIPESAIVTVITNMNVDFASNRIVKKLEKRSRVSWSMSFDNIGQQFEYVRYHGIWSNTVNNVQQVRQYIDTLGHWGGIHAVYNLYNCTRLCELRTWADQHQLKINWQTLHQPLYLDPTLHNAGVRDAAVAEINKYQSQFKLTPNESTFFDAVQKRMQQDYGPDYVHNSFWDHINEIENKYHAINDTRRFSNLWPELKDII